MAKDKVFEGATDTVKKGFTKIVGSISSLASTGSNFVSDLVHKEGKKEKEVSEKKQNTKVIQQETVLDSSSSMRNWLMSVRSNVNPAVAETIQGQLYVLSFVQSPAMSGMAVDNLIFCLDKSLKQASSDSEKEFVRETFCSMIQNLMFIGDARLTYAINKNREEASALLTQAGEMLDSSISAIASTVTSATPEAILPKVANIFSNQGEKNGFFKKLGAWIGQKKEEENKKAEYYTTIKNMYRTLDKYSPLIGPSILIYGMLDRYRPMVIDYYKEQWDKDYKKRSGAGINTASSLMIASGQLLETVSNPKKLGENVKKAGKTIGSMARNFSLADLKIAQKRLTADLMVAEREIENIKQEVEDVNTQLKSAGAFKIGKKKTLSKKLEELEKRLETSTKNRNDIDYKLLQVGELIKQEAPMMEEIEKMEADMKRITEKYAIAF